MHPILLKLGPFTLYSFGVALALAFVGATWFGQWTMLRAHRLGARSLLTASQVADTAFWILLAGILGARALYVGTHWAYYREHPVEIVAIWHGGLIFYGGLVSGIVTGWWFLRRQRVPLGQTVDLLTPIVPLSQAIGRVGCFLNGCCYGKPTTSGLGVVFHWDVVPRYPTQLFESAATLLMAIAFSAWNFHRRTWERPTGGRVFLTYLLLYGAWRFGIEFWRGDNPPIAAGLNVPQWISLGLITLSGAWLIRRR